jgi:hypothetical protein
MPTLASIVRLGRRLGGAAATRRAAAVLVGTLVALALGAPGAELGSPARAVASGGTFRVIANPANPTNVVEQKFLVDAFLKKISRWPSGSVIRPVDQRPDSPVRRRFSEEVLKRPLAAVKSYWQQLVFSGRDVPPPELDSEEEVVRYVLRHAGGLGYVSADANLGGAKVVTVR